MNNMNRDPIGVLVRDWRSRRRISQLDLAHRVGVSARHLSFVETGRSRPSPELVLALGIELEVPLREQNTMLLAAGFAPRYAETRLEAPASAVVQSAIERLLAAHNPYPGVVVDRAWNVVSSNQSAGLLISMLPAHLLQPPLNVYRLSLHPDGLARHTVNFDDWAGHLIRQLRRDLATTGNRNLAELLEEVSSYPTVMELEDRRMPPTPELLMPFQLEVDGRAMSFFTTLTAFGTPQDITIDEMLIELFYPADEETRRLLSG